MKFLVLLIVGSLLVLSCPVWAQHPQLSIRGTGVFETENWHDTFLLELQTMKNLENGVGAGIKVGTDFSNEVEISVALRTIIKPDFYGYFDFGYALEQNEGFIGEVGLGIYFEEHRRLGFHLGMKYYADPKVFALPVGVSVNF